MAKTIVIILYEGKHTPGTIRFEAESTANPDVKAIYIQRTAYDPDDIPGAVKVTIEPIE